MRPIDADALIEFCAERWIPLNIDAVNMQPTIQPEKAQLSSEDATSDLISRQAAIDAIAQCTNCGDEDTLREYVLKHSLNNGWTGGILEALDAVKNLPPAQPELTDEQAITHLQSSGWMQRHDKEMYESGLKEYLADDSDSYDSLLPSAQPEPKEWHWINGKCDRCGEHAPFWCMASTYHESNYCPHCGAKMTISTK